MRRLTHAPRYSDFIAGVWKTSCYDRCKPSTRKRMDSVLATQLLPEFGHLPLNRIGRANVHKWFDEYSKKAPAGANRALDVLRQSLNFAVDCGHIESNPARLVKRNRRPERTRFLSSEEVARLHAALDRHNGRGSGRQQAEIIRLLLATGCRKSEILALRWSEVEGDSLRLADSKTGPRTVLLNRRAQKILTRQPRKDSQYVFPDLADPDRCRSEELSLWRKLRRELGFDDVRLHDLRHTFASHAVMQQVPLPVVSLLLGHSKAHMTFRYAHASDMETQRAAQRVGSALADALDGNLPAASGGNTIPGPRPNGSANAPAGSLPPQTCCPCCNTLRDTHDTDMPDIESVSASANYERESLERLLRNHMTERSWSITEAAVQLGCSRQTLSRVLNRRMGISTAMALAFERIGWRNAAFWVCAQALRELELSRERSKVQDSD